MKGNDNMEGLKYSCELLEDVITRLSEKSSLDQHEKIALRLAKNELAIVNKINVGLLEYTGTKDEFVQRLEGYSVFIISSHEYEKMQKAKTCLEKITKLLVGEKYEI